MDEILLSHEAGIRYYLLIGGFGLVAVWEALAPRRALRSTIGRRWLTNIGLILLISVGINWLFPLLAVGVAVAAKSSRFGLLNWIAVPELVAVAATLVVLDLTRYVQHVLLHRLPVLWRLHRVHHTDTDYDLTTGLRFHPLEALFMVSGELLVVALLGAPPLAVLIYEVLYIVTGFTNHGNIRLPVRAERILRRVLVTPEMHCVHHSILREETDSNFSAVFSGWDRLFRTYRAQPHAGHANMRFGLPEWRDQRCVSLPWLLALPFRRA